MSSSSRSRRAETEIREAVRLHQGGRLEEAARLFRRWLPFQPAHPLLLTGLGTLELQRGNLAEGITLLTRSLAVQPAQPRVASHLGVALARQGRWAEAREALHRALRLQPGDGDAWVHLAQVSQELGDGEGALAAWDQALTLRPGEPEWLGNRGALHLALGRPEAALADFDGVLARVPDSGLACQHRAKALELLGRLDEALAAAERAVALLPGSGAAYKARGDVYLAREDHGAAIRDYDRALALGPDLPTGRWAKSLLQLLVGDFPGGWRGYQARWQCPQFLEPRRAYPQPLWLGAEPLAGRRLLVWAEQGYGDWLQFSRLVQPLLGQAGAVILEVPDALLPLARAWSWGDGPAPQLVAKGEPLPPFDCHLPLLSLPLALGLTVDTVPPPLAGATIPPAAVAPWAQRLGDRAGDGAMARPRIGLVLSGSPHHGNDARRSLPLARLAPLLDLPVEWYLLQPELRETDQAWLKENGWRQGEDWAPGGGASGEQNRGAAVAPGTGTAVREIQETQETQETPIPSWPCWEKIPVASVLAPDSAEAEAEAEAEAGAGAGAGANVGVGVVGAAALPGRVTPVQGGRLHCPGAALTDFAQTAALAGQMDRIISVDTAPAHLAGTLGLPLWLLLPHTPDFRWLLKRQDSPWYPSATLFRQTREGDWDSVVAQVGGALQAWLADRVP